MSYIRTCDEKNLTNASSVMSLNNESPCKFIRDLEENNSPYKFVQL